MQIPSVIELLKAGVHFGHQSSRWHPKMKPFIFGSRGGVHIIDVEKTQDQLANTLNFVTETAARGGSIVFVGTKRQAQSIVEKYAKEAGMPYINTRWLGGTLTNFGQVQRLIRHYLDLKDKMGKGELKKYTKLEQLQFSREIEELDGKIGGLSTLTRLPDALFIVDARMEKTAVREATTMGVPMLALVDSNVNPTGIKYVIPGNDDAVGSIEMVTKLVAEAVKEGKAKAIANAKAAAEVRKSAEDDVKISEVSKNVVDDLDDAMKEKLAAEAAEGKKE
ncbi:MAG: 30S ribosomal protein S2 [Candidatus Uhrbacteria bacterium GW2011_GWD2_52_7]|uniref:Small ribosomal subunit protein uS2 n=1 Tax=Candidatus Uhrbacteria bacterium GW2011_GWD2_52_7 TaxID=1618989 RepID=A0A0G1XGM4_9BACT|nr:MAG: 30S ribosomal protein S2 [Candidatus Uhrbacteria bacterium GW2011_GWD2_52_7]